MFKWDVKNTKSTIWNADIGSKEIREFSPKEILTTPNFHQFEGIVSALCKAVTELIAIEEERNARMTNFMRSDVQASEAQMSLFEQENSNGNESVSTGI
jgi:hypothetical protein